MTPHGFEWERLMCEYVHYPVQPFVFEFSKEAARKVSFRDVKFNPPPQVDLGPITRYLESNGRFLDELSNGDRDDAFDLSLDVASIHVDPLFYDPSFDIKKASIFERVFPDGCLKRRLFGESLVIQLDAVQSQLLRASDQSALQFFSSFSSIYDMDSKLAELIPVVADSRAQLQKLEKITESPQLIKKLNNKSQSSKMAVDCLNAVKEMIRAPDEAIALAKNGEFNEAYQVLDAAKQMLEKRFLGVKSLRSLFKKLGSTSEEIDHLLIIAHCQASIGENDSRVEDLLKERGLFEMATAKADDYLKEFVVAQIRKLIEAACHQLHPDDTFESLTVNGLVDVIGSALPAIRLKIIEKFSSPEISTIVFKEVTEVIISHPLKNAAIDDFSNIFEALVSFGRVCQKYGLEGSVLNNSLVLFGKYFVKSFHQEQFIRLSSVLSHEKWTYCAPNQSHLEILKKLTTGNAITSLSINGETYGSSASLLILLEIIWQYFSGVRQIKKTADELTGNLAEIITTFSTTSRKLLLNGEAIDNHILKSISTRNMAISASGLDFINAIIPYLKPRLGIVGANQSKVDEAFMGVVSELKTHTEDLLNKIVWVIGNQVNAQLKKEGVTSDGLAQAGISEYARRIVKEFQTLNRAISDILPPSRANLLYAVIAEQTSTQIESFYRSIGPRFEAQITRDVDYINEQTTFTNNPIRFHGASH